MADPARFELTISDFERTALTSARARHDNSSREAYGGHVLNRADFIVNGHCTQSTSSDIILASRSGSIWPCGSTGITSQVVPDRRGAGRRQRALMLNADTRILLRPAGARCADRSSPISNSALVIRLDN